MSAIIIDFLQAFWSLKDVWCDSEQFCLWNSFGNNNKNTDMPASGCMSTSVYQYNVNMGENYPVQNTAGLELSVERSFGLRTSCLKTNSGERPRLI